MKTQKTLALKRFFLFLSLAVCISISGHAQSCLTPAFSSSVVSMCPGGSASLSVTNSPAQTKWYNAATGGTLLGTTNIGGALQVSPTSTTTYYAENTIPAVSGNLTFNYTGAVQTWIVPAGVTSININAYGAQGGSNSSQGGLGGRVQTVMTVTPGQILYIYVGGKGSTTAGGFNGGGNIAFQAPPDVDPGGGGATDIRIGGTTLYDRVLVAGGGGGAGADGTYYNTNFNGGAGGGSGTAGNGLSRGTYCNKYCGAGALISDGGAAATYAGISFKGTFGQGGDAYYYNYSGNAGGGGGGGGFFGGGGGVARYYTTCNSNQYNNNGGGGGGGSSYTSSICSNTTHFQGVQAGNGLLQISYNSSGCTSARTPIVVTINSAPILTATPAAICPGGSAQINAVNNGAQINWYNAPVGGTLLGTTVNGASLQVSPLVTTTYYAESFTSAGSCTSARTPLVVTVNNTAPDVSASTDTIGICGTALLTANGTGFNVNWYDAPTGGTLVGTTNNGGSLEVRPATTTTYYAENVITPVSGSQTFSYTGAVQTFIVPVGITTINVDAYGAQGTGNSGTGGRGGRVQANLAVTPGQILNIYVGSQAGNNGGGISSGPAGGGASDIRIGGTSLANRVLVAGGGGGTYSSSYPGAPGGGLTGGNCGLYGGSGGTQTAGGISSSGSTFNGSPGQGGAAGGLDNTGQFRYGGGGGGGYYGGGGGNSGGGGGGGSSYVTGAGSSGIIHTQGARQGDGQITITYNSNTTSCVSPRSFHVVNVVNSGPRVASPVVTICAGSTATLSASALTATGSYTIKWYNSLSGGTLIGTTTNCGSLTVSPATVTTYYAESVADNIVTQTFLYTGALQTSTVPAGMTSVSIDAYGAQGTGYNLTSGGLGGRVMAKLAVTPGQILNIYVGSITGYNGGGIGVNGKGGGATDIRIGGTALTNRVLVAGGGGGTGSSTAYPGGAGGGLTGGNGNNGGTYGGRGGTQTGGGILSGFASGSLGQGGGQFGGGGYYGGSDGACGGGGSSYVTSAGSSAISHFQGVQQGNGKITLTYSGAPLCTSPRTSCVVNINNVAPAVTDSSIEICPGETATLSTPDYGTKIKWYDAATGGNLIGITTGGGSLPVNPAVTQTYYAERVVSATDTLRFAYTGAAQSWTVPAGVTSINIDAYGAQGGTSNNATGGRGGRTVARMNVTPGQLLNIYVGGKGRNMFDGFNGAGAPFVDPEFWGGGGATDIRVGGLALTHRVLVAGGGGGAGDCTGGVCAGLTGNNGVNCNPAYTGFDGAGGNSSNSTFSYWQGTRYSAGGGGGYYNGSGGRLVFTVGYQSPDGTYFPGQVLYRGSGGGGSSWVTPTGTSSISYGTGAQTGDGKLIISYTGGIGCSSPRAAVVVKVNTTAPVAQNVTLNCGSTADISATAQADSIKWYDAAVGGNLIATTASGANLQVSPLLTTTYYAAGSVNNAQQNITRVYSYTGDVQNFTVPAGISSLKVEACGASGGGEVPGYPAYGGGLGGRVTADMSVTPGSTLYLYVGEQGGEVTLGGYNGGGSGGPDPGHKGGGATDIRIGGTNITNRVLIAGGGGGSGDNTTLTGPVLPLPNKGGAGGGLMALTGQYQGVTYSTTCGGGGTQISGGSGGVGPYGTTAQQGKAGELFQGGEGGFYGGAGGGGGFYGGGGGGGYGWWNGAGGGGGSSYTDPVSCSNVNHFQGVCSGNGQIKIMYTIPASVCMSPLTPVTVTVIPTITPAVSIVASVTTICTGTSVSFTATPVNGGTTPVYQWQKNGVNTGNNAPTFVTTTLANNDVITCVMTSNHNCLITPVATSNAITITVNHHPVISSQPVQSMICAGGNTTFNVSATGSATFNYQWQVSPLFSPGWSNLTNTAPYGNVTAATMTVTSAIPSITNTVYRCLVDNGCGGPTTTSVAILYVNTIPQAATPADTNVCEGSACSFRTPLSSGSLVSYQWQLSTNGGTSWANQNDNTVYSGMNSALMNIASTTAGMDGYRYRNFISNMCGSTTTPYATLSVGSLNIAKQPADTSILQPNVAFFAVNVIGNGTLNYQWQLSTNGGVTFADQADGGVYTGMTTATMSIAWATSTFNGYRYRVRVANTVCSAISSPAQLTIMNPASAGLPFPPTSVCQGNSTNFSVSLSPSPLVKYQWQISTNNGASWTNQANGGSYSGMTSNMMLISNVSTSMSGYKYRCCTYFDVSNYAYSRVSTIIVNTPPSINVQPSSTLACEGANAVFSITAGGSAPLQYQWQSSTGGGVLWADQLNAGIYTNMTTATMGITGANAGINLYQYRCKVINTCGSIQSDPAILTVDTPAIPVLSGNSPVCEGGTLNLSNTTPAVIYNWSGPNGFTSTSQTPVINAVTTAMGGIYTVTGKSIAGCQSAPATITIAVNTKPVISVQPVADTVMANNRATYFVKAGKNAEAYRWLVSADTGSTWNNTSGAVYTGTNDSILTLDLNMVTPAMAGNKYRCSVSNTCGAVQSNAVLFQLGSISGTVMYQYRPGGAGPVTPYPIYKATSGKGTKLYLYNQASNIPIDSTDLKSGGFYAFSNLKPGKYGLGVKTGLKWLFAYTNNTDASKILTDSTSLKGIFNLAGRTQTIESLIPTVDANAITMRWQPPDSTSNFPTGAWVFAAVMSNDSSWINNYGPGIYLRNMNYTKAVKTTNTTLNVGVLQVGDVNGNRPAAMLKSTLVPEFVGNMIAVPGQIIDVPVKLNTGMKLNAVTMIISGPGRKATIEDIIMPGNNGSNFFWTEKDGKVYINWIGAGSIDITTDDVFLVMKLRISEDFGFEDAVSATGIINFMELGNENGEVIMGASVNIPAINYGVDDLTMTLGNSIPNPVNGTSRIPYYIPSEGKVQMGVYNMIGECVATLVSESQGAGYHETQFDAGSLANGIYTYRLSLTTNSRSKVINKKLVVTH